MSRNPVGKKPSFLSLQKPGWQKTGFLVGKNRVSFSDSEAIAIVAPPTPEPSLTATGHQPRYCRDRPQKS